MKDDVIKKFLIKIKGDEKMQIELLRLCAIQAGGASQHEIYRYLTKRKGLKADRINELIDAGVKAWQN